MNNGDDEDMVYDPSREYELTAYLIKRDSSEHYEVTITEWTDGAGGVTVASGLGKSVKEALKLAAEDMYDFED